MVLNLKKKESIIELDMFKSIAALGCLILIYLNDQPLTQFTASSFITHCPTQNERVFSLRLEISQ